MESKLNDGKDSLVANKHSKNEKEEEEDLEWDADLVVFSFVSFFFYCGCSM